MQIPKATIFRLTLISFLVATFVYSFFEVPLPEDETKIWFYNGQHFSFNALVVEEPDVRIGHTKLIVEAQYGLSGKTLVNVSLYPKYQYGDLLFITCRLQAPEPFSGFAYDRYLAKDNIYSICSFPKVKLVSRNNGDYLMTKIFKFKNKLRQTINQNLPEPQASLFSAIILGARRGIPAELSEKFSLTGTSHLIAISGLHITIITAILMKIGLSLYLPRKKLFWIITVALMLYVTLIGFPPSAVRASIMGWLAMFAMYIGRLNKSVNALILVASLMVFINPKILRDDIGFQLSFSAVLGLIYISPLFESWLAKFPSYLGIKESLQMTLSAQVTTMPLIIYYFGRLSLVGPLSNLLVLPILPYLMMFGVGSVSLSLLIPSLSQYIFWPTWFLLSLLIKIIEILTTLPYAAIDFN